MPDQTDATTIKASVLDGLLMRADLARQLSCGERTILRYEHCGMPVIKIGLRTYYDPAAVRAWIQEQAPKRACNRDPVRRGRPAKRAA